MMATDAMGWGNRAPSNGSEYFNLQNFGNNNGQGDFGRSLSLGRANSAVDMRQLTNALVDAREGTGEVRSILLKAAFRPRLPGLTKMVSKLSKEGAWRKALEVFETVEELGLRADTALTNSAISACDKGGRWQKALELFDRMEAMRLPRDAITYSATISALAKGKQWHAALQVFDHMQAAGVEADVVTCCSLINALERGGQWQLAEKLFLQMCTVQPDSLQMPLSTNLNGGGSRLARSQTSPTSVLNALRAGVAAGTARSLQGSDGGLPSVSETEAISGGIIPLASTGIITALKPQLSSGSMEDFQQLAGTPPPADGLDGLSSAFARAATITPSTGDRPLSAGSHPFTPNLGEASGSHNVLFRGGSDASEYTPGSGTSSLGGSSFGAPHLPSSYLQRSGSLRWDPNGPQQAEAAAHLRRAMSCFPDVDTGQSPGAGGLASMFNFSHAARVTPNRVCCNALLAAYARAKPPQWQKALHLLSAMWSGGPTLTPDAVSYNTVIKACASAFQLGRALDVFTEMTCRGVLPNATTYNSLITAAAESGSGPVLQQVGGWLDTAPGDVRVACTNGFVAGLAKVGLWDEVMMRYRDMMSHGSMVHPTPATFNTIMTGYMHMGDYDAVRRTFNEMRAAGVPPSIVAYNTLLNALASSGNWAEALDVLGAVLSSANDGVNASTVTFNAVLGALCKGAATAPQAQHAFIASRGIQVFQQMQGAGAGAAPDAATYASLIAVLDATGHTAHIVAVHDIMAAAGLTPDRITASSILNAAVACGQTARAVQLAHTLQLQGVAVDAPLLTSLLGSCLTAGAWDLATRLCSSTQVAQGGAAASVMFNYVLQSALAAGEYNVAVDVLGMMQTANLEVDATVAAKLLGTTGGSGSPSQDSSTINISAPLPSSMLDSLQAATVTFNPDAPPSPGTQLVGVSVGSPATPNLEATLSPRASISSSSPRPTPTRPDQVDGHISSNLNSSPGTGGGSGGGGTADIQRGTAQGQGTALGQGALTLVDTNAMLKTLYDTNDAQGCLEVLSNMKLAGIAPDMESFHCVIAALVQNGDAHRAMQICKEGHKDGVLKHYNLHDTLSEGMKDSFCGDLDLQRCPAKVAAAICLAWLSSLVQLGCSGVKLESPMLKITLAGDTRSLGQDGEVERSQNDADVDSLCSELVEMLTTGNGAFKALSGAVSLTLPKTAVSINTATPGVCAIELQTSALYSSFN